MPFALGNHNPDVLNTIANLSNDEVFTPPEMANEMLDTLEQSWSRDNDNADIWSDPSLTFLDPFTKSGVFLREITSRLIKGLESKIPDLQERVDHVLTKQVFGIGLTHLTALLARRTVYCSKNATGKHSIATSFDRDWGNIWFERTEHTWSGGTDRYVTMDSEGNSVEKTTNGRCTYCGVRQRDYERDKDLESHAYAFIHTNNAPALLTSLFGEAMQFDVIIGNPPYQMSDGGGGGSARPIYPLFTKQAMALEPRYLCLITPSRWLVGGRGLGSYRSSMLADRRNRVLVDYLVATDAFPGLNINGGVSYFLWSRDSQGDCEVTTVFPGGSNTDTQHRRLDEYDVFIRNNLAITILRKVQSVTTKYFSRRVYSTRPFGLRTNFHGSAVYSKDKPIKLYGHGKTSWISDAQVTNNKDILHRWKVLIPAASDGNETYPLPIWDQTGPFIAGPNQVCTETYLVASTADTLDQAKSIQAYMRTKFFRFLVSLRKVAQHNKGDNFRFVPDLPLDRKWTDEDLYQRFDLTDDEIEFIETQIRTMGYGDD